MNVLPIKGHGKELFSGFGNLIYVKFLESACKAKA